MYIFMIFMENANNLRTLPCNFHINDTNFDTNFASEHWDYQSQVPWPGPGPEISKWRGPGPDTWDVP